MSSVIRSEKSQEHRLRVDQGRSEIEEMRRDLSRIKDCLAALGADLVARKGEVVRLERVREEERRKGRKAQERNVKVKT